MKSISQIFAENLKKDNQDNCIELINHYGIRETKALSWLSMTSKNNDEIISFLFDPKNTYLQDLSENDKGHSFLLLLSNEIAWKYKKNFTEKLFKKLSPEWIINNNVAHFAAFNGSHQVLSLIKNQNYKNTLNEPYHWESEFDSDNLSPLYYSLTEGHIEASVMLLVNGASELLEIDDPKNKFKKIPVLTRVFREHKCFPLQELKNHWNIINTKYQIEKEIYSKNDLYNEDIMDSHKQDRKQTGKKLVL